MINPGPFREEPNKRAPAKTSPGRVFLSCVTSQRILFALPKDFERALSAMKSVFSARSGVAAGTAGSARKAEWPSALPTYTPRRSLRSFSFRVWLVTRVWPFSGTILASMASRIQLGCGKKLSSSSWAGVIQFLLATTVGAASR